MDFSTLGQVPAAPDLSDPAYGRPWELIRYTTSSGQRITAPRAERINKVSTSTQERQLTLAAENAPIRLIYGEVRLGAQLLNVLAYGSNIVIQCLWGYACEGVQSITLNDAALPTGSTATHYDGSQSSADATMVAAFAAQTPAVTYEDDLAGFAYSVLVVPATKLTGGLSINAVVRGREVYDPRTTSTAYSTNPTLILADFLASTTYGAGLTVDWTTAETCADLNDATTIGEVHRRLDGWSLDQVRGVGDVVETLRAYAGVFLSMRGGTVYFIPDAARSSDATYAHASGQIQSYGRWSKRDTSDSPTVVEIIWTDTSVTPHRERSAVASLAGVGTTRPRRLSTVRMNGLQRHSQAYREAVERLNKLSTSDLTGEITVFDQGIAHEPGDVVTVTLPFGITSKAMRVTAPAESAGPGLWRLQLAEYDADAYSTEIQSEASYPDTDLPNPGAPPQPTVVASEEVYQTETGIYASRARLTITASTFIWTKHYEVEIWDGTDLVDSGTTQTGSYASPPLQEGVTYTCRARVVSTLGAAGEWGQDSFTAQGKSLVPGDVASVTGFEVGGDVYLAWDAAVDVDIWRYEIRWGTTSDTWATASLLDRIDGLRYISKGVVTPGVRRFFVKAIDSIGQYSDTAAYADITVTIDPDALQLEYYPDSPTLTSMTNFAERDGTSFDITVVGTSSFASTFSSNVSTYTEPVSAYWGGNGTSTSVWEGDSDDPWGLSIAATWDIDATYDDVGTGSATVALRLSTDGTSFTDYSGTSLPAKTSARYARAKLYTTACLKVMRGDIRIYGNAVTRSEYGSVVVTSTGTPGAEVTLTGSYFQRRNILLTPVENGTASYYAVADNIQLSTSTDNTFDVYMFDSGGNRVAGTCDYRFEGI